jgi:hypothetical protein
MPQAGGAGAGGLDQRRQDLSGGHSIPKDIDRSQLRLGRPGTATVFAANAGVIGLIMSILVWINSYTAYL